MRNASGDNYRNSSFIVDEAMGQIPHSTERISSFLKLHLIFRGITKHLVVDFKTANNG